MFKSFSFAVLILLTTISCSDPASSEDDPEHSRITSSSGRQWQLVWNDEFNDDGMPVGARWDYEVGYIRNNESQYYTRARAENTRIEGGNLVIESRREQYSFPPNGTAQYTSASLTTRGRAAWTYGRIEVRAKLPRGRGMWPAIWMLGTNISEVGWPACGEIDIMEHVGFQPGTIHSAIHTRSFNHVIGTQKGGGIGVTDPYDTFHVYAVEWLEDRLEFFLDGTRYFVFEKQEGYTNDEWPFDKPHYLILNAAIGGGWGGQQGIDQSIFPTQYVIDYVRVYERVE